jgi:hypothetical protein
MEDSREYNVDERQVLKIWENWVTELYDRTNRSRNLQIETEGKVDEDEKRPYILLCEVENAVKQVKDEKATGDDDDDDYVRGHVLKAFGEDDIKILTELFSIIYKSGEWPQDFTEVKMTALKKKPKATKCSDHRTVSLIAFSAKTVAKIERNIEEVLEENQF